MYIVTVYAVTVPRTVPRTGTSSLLFCCPNWVCLGCVLFGCKLWFSIVSPTTPICRRKGMGTPSPPWW